MKMRLDGETPAFNRNMMRDMLDVMFYRRKEDTLFEELRVFLNALKAGSVQRPWVRTLQSDYRQSTLGNEQHSRFGSSMRQDIKMLIMHLARTDYNGILQRALVNMFSKGRFVYVGDVTCSFIVLFRPEKDVTKLQFLIPMISPGMLLLGSLRLMMVDVGKDWLDEFETIFDFEYIDEEQLNFVALFEVLF